MSKASSITSQTSTNVVALVSAHDGRKTYRVRGTHFEIDERYSVTSVVGHGAYGVVCAALDESTGKEVAIKRIGRVFDDLIDGRRIWREVRILRLLRDAKCRNVMKLHRLLRPRESIDVFRDLYVVTELLETDLYAVIRQRSDLMTVSSLRNIGAQMIRCLADMHSMGVIHRDIKPSNILLTSSEEVRVCDFGLARGGLHVSNDPMDLTDYVVTRWYRPPELLSMSKYHFPVDVWGAGCVLAEYALQRPLFAGRDYLHQLHLILSTVNITGLEFITSKASVPFITDLATKTAGSRPLSKVLAVLPSDAIDLISAMLAFDPHRRITARKALSHPFFKSVGGDGQDTPPRPLDGDWSFDMACEVSEPQLRRCIWNEIEISEVNDRKRLL